MPPFKPSLAWPGLRTLEGVEAGRVPRGRPQAGRCIFGFFRSLLLRQELVCVGARSDVPSMGPVGCAHYRGPTGCVHTGIRPGVPEQSLVVLRLVVLLRAVDGEEIRFELRAGAEVA